MHEMQTILSDVCQSVVWLKSAAAHALYAACVCGSFGAAFVKLL